MLLGRTTELGYLNNYYDRDGSQILIVYGQKHIGKTALVKEFMKDRPGYYYLASACSEREQAYLWGRQLTHDGYVVDKFPTFQEIFEKLAHRVTGKKVLVIDEFQNIVRASDAFMKDLVAFVHSQWNRDDVMVILVSSSIGWIENSMITRIGEELMSFQAFLRLRRCLLQIWWNGFRISALKSAWKPMPSWEGFPGCGISLMTD